LLRAVARSRLTLFRRDVALGLRGTLAEEKFLHLLAQELARLGLDDDEPVLVDQHRLVAEPLLPGFPGDVFIDALAEFPRIGRPLEPLGFAAQQHALDGSAHGHSFVATAATPDGSDSMSRLTIAASPSFAGVRALYQTHRPGSMTAAGPAATRAVTGSISSSKCVKPWRTGSSGSAISTAVPITRRAQSATASSPSTGGHQSPPQMPCRSEEH